MFIPYTIVQFLGVHVPIIQYIHQTC